MAPMITGMTKLVVVVAVSRISLARHAACVDYVKSVSKILVESLKERNYSEDLSVDGRMILR
jgi:hypothetical protein